MTNPEFTQPEENEQTPQADNGAETNGSAAETTDQPSAEQKLQSENAELKDKYIRLVAEFDNFRKRTLREKDELVKTASENVIKAILPVLDDIERAQATYGEDGKVDTQGIELIFNKLTKAVAGKGLKAMESKGQAFDPDLHESITQFPAPSEDLKGKVIDEVEKGYYLGDKVIRFAKVVVGV
ncbi:nucleotide exchange factor GrpE [Siphonobacter sp.]|uniref:nucleotide exchange factor GrpE n=1 Tax=Siphonobacter sp. TaxID=1869184 RepID=UPI003B3B1D11